MSRPAALPRLLRALRTRFAQGWSRLPRAARRRWVRAISIGVAGLLGFIVLLESGGRRLAEAGHLDWETDALHRIATEFPLSFSTAVWIQTLGTDITLVLLVLVTAGIAAWIRRPVTALTIAASVALLDPVIRIGWAMWERARPTVVMDGIASPGFASFPSGHTAKAVALYGILAYVWIRASGHRVERAIAATVFALVIALVMIGRLRMGVHWPSDVIAGLVLGGVWLAILIAARRTAGDDA